MAKFQKLTPREKSELEGKISAHVKDNYYHHAFNGITQFVCRGIIVGKGNTIYPDLASRNAIYTKDTKWEGGLQAIGLKYGLKIILSPDIYAK